MEEKREFFEKIFTLDDRSDTGLGPEVMRFTESSDARALTEGESYYILRPESVESYFLMWRLTKDPKGSHQSRKDEKLMEMSILRGSHFPFIIKIFRNEP